MFNKRIEECARIENNTKKNTQHLMTLLITRMFIHFTVFCNWNFYIKK